MHPSPPPFSLCRKRPHFNPTSKKEDSHEPRGVRGEFGRETETGKERERKSVFTCSSPQPNLAFHLLVKTSSASSRVHKKQFMGKKEGKRARGNKIFLLLF